MSNDYEGFEELENSLTFTGNCNLDRPFHSLVSLKVILWCVRVLYSDIYFVHGDTMPELHSKHEIDIFAVC
jgi:hypothetical protein